MVVVTVVDAVNVVGTTLVVVTTRGKATYADANDKETSRRTANATSACLGEANGLPL